jgi:hypothetical protein
MRTIVAIDPDRVEFVAAEEDRPPRLRLFLTTREGQSDVLILEGKALRDLALIVRTIQADFPGALGGH